MTGEELRACRKENGLKQRELAEELNNALGVRGYNKVIISLVESGLVELPENAMRYVASKYSYNRPNSPSVARNCEDRVIIPTAEKKSLKSAVSKRRRRMGIKTLEEEVREILIGYPKSRDSNEYLYGTYLAKHGITIQSVNSFFMGFEKLGVSSFESVTRARRKIVEKDPSLGASEEVKQMRLERQFDMWDYAKDRL